MKVTGNWIVEVLRLSIKEANAPTEAAAAPALTLPSKRNEAAGLRLPYVKNRPRVEAVQPVARHGAIVSLFPLEPLDIGTTHFVGKGIAACHGPHLSFLPWSGSSSWALSCAYHLLPWSGPFSILLYRDYGLSATLIGLIAGATAALHACQLLAWLSGQMGAAQHPAVRLPGVRRQCGPARPLPTRWAGWHSRVIGSGLSYGLIDSPGRH